jgi:hypothetical protein
MAGKTPQQETGCLQFSLGAIGFVAGAFITFAVISKKDYWVPDLSVAILTLEVWPFGLFGGLVGFCTTFVGYRILKNRLGR